eukprot:1350829-Rhodomonas_salina.1
MAEMLNAQQVHFDKGGQKTIQKFLGKLGEMPSLWGVLPRAEDRHYPWVISLTGEARERFKEW